eukprot:12431436-Karenia_brevis.AAC.3
MAALRNILYTPGAGTANGQQIHMQPSYNLQLQHATGINPTQQMRGHIQICDESLHVFQPDLNARSDGCTLVCLRPASPHLRATIWPEAVEIFGP